MIFFKPLKGTITSWTGNPVEGALVKGFDSPGTKLEYETNATGQFNFDVQTMFHYSEKDFTNDRTITVPDALTP
ncbi:MAG: hypothetical protein CM15mP106_1280 [Candidatus Neomarinimicrobiota bacterium]|nr:MAG: hypothetical protein CM15mP106_1280 [Candidatus Neomarinimicrobiota bacterium]